MSAQCYDEWSQMLLDNCGHFYGVCDSDDTGFDGHFKVHHWYDLDVVNLSCDIEKIKRTTKDARRDDHEYIFLLKQVSGQTTTVHNDKCCVLNPGDFFLLDSTLSSEMIYQGARSEVLSVHMPRTEFLDWCQADVEIGEVCRANDLKGRVLDVAFPKEKEHFKTIDVGSDFLFDLARIAFLQEKKHTSVMRFSCSKNRHFATLQILNQNLTNPELSLEWLARAAKVSPRQLQRDFQSEGTSFSSVLTERRLSLFVFKLRQCLQLGRTPNIAYAAFDCGFGDISNFNRAFKKRYGCCPTEYLAQITKETPTQ